MSNFQTSENYQNAKLKAKEIYKKIGRVWCPALTDYVYFSNVGFKHLVRKGKRLRSKRDQMRRFSLIPYAANIVTKAKGEILYDEKKEIAIFSEYGEKIKTLPPAKFWTIENNHDKEIIFIVIRQVEMEKKHFFSIYNQKIAEQGDPLVCPLPADR